MNRNLKPIHRHALVVLGALSLAATQAFADTSAYPMPKTRDEVKAEMHDARANGELAVEEQGAEARYVHIRDGQEPSSTLSREAVIDEVRQIRESGQKLNSDPERSRFRPDTSPVIESPAPVVILAPAPQAQPAPQPQAPLPEDPANRVTPEDAPLQSGPQGF